MNRRHAFLLLVFILSGSYLLRAQGPYFTVTTTNTQHGPEYEFTPDWTALLNDYPLNMNHPQADYRFFWIFGDGQFSTLENPVHRYENAGNYEVQMRATPMYSPTDPPPDFEMILPGVLPHALAAPMNVTDPVLIRVDRRPRVDYENLNVVIYKNTENHTINGRLYFKYDSQYFDMEGDMLYHGESLHSTQSINDPNYDTARIYNLGSMAPGETRAMFVVTKALPSTAANGNFPLLFIGVDLIDGGQTLVGEDVYKTRAVSGWDPNQVSFHDPGYFVYDDWPNPAMVTMRIDFENTGTSVVTDVATSTEISDLLDASSIQLVDFEPKDVNPNIDVIGNTLHCSQSGISLGGTQDPDLIYEDQTSGYYVFSFDLLDQSEYDPELYIGEEKPPVCAPYLSIPAYSLITFDFGQSQVTDSGLLNFYQSGDNLCDSDFLPPPLEVEVEPNPVNVQTNYSVTINDLPQGFNLLDVVANIVNIQSGEPVTIQEISREVLSATSAKIIFGEDTPAGLYTALVSYQVFSGQANFIVSE